MILFKSRAGDIIGSVYEQSPIKTKALPLFDRRCRFTENTVLTVGVALAILDDRPYHDTCGPWAGNQKNYLVLACPG